LAQDQPALAKQLEQAPFLSLLTHL